MTIATGQTPGGTRLSLNELAETLGVGRRTVSRWRKAGMPCYPTVRGKAVEAELEEVVAWCKRTGRGLGKGAEGAGIMRGIFSAGQAAAGGPLGLPEEPPSLPAPGPSDAQPIDREAQITAVGHSAWQAVELAMRTVSQRIASGEFEPGPRDAKALVDAALALEKRARPGQDEAGLVGMTLIELATLTQERMADQWGLAGPEVSSDDSDDEN